MKNYPLEPKEAEIFFILVYRLISILYSHSMLQPGIHISIRTEKSSLTLGNN